MHMKVKPLGFFFATVTMYICTGTLCNHALPSSFPHPTNFLSILFSPFLSHLQRHTLLSLPPSRALTVLSLFFVQSFHYITRALGFRFVCFFIIYTCRACPRFTKKKNWLDKSNLRVRPGDRGVPIIILERKRKGELRFGGYVVLCYSNRLFA